MRPKNLVVQRRGQKQILLETVELSEDVLEVVSYRSVFSRRAQATCVEAPFPLRNEEAGVTKPASFGVAIRSRKEARMARISLRVNNQSRVVETDPTTPLLYVLRDDLELHGPRFGCGLGQCGACTVIMDSSAVRSCSIPVSAAQSRGITTLEGLGTLEHPHVLQTAFIQEQAAQCGYCMNGMIMTAKALLDKNPKPSDDQIKQALNGNLCRCGSHLRVIRAVKRAAGVKA
jgi:nicotinate dehydrogenase subunit A